MLYVMQGLLIISPEKFGHAKWDFCQLYCASQKYTCVCATTTKWNWVNNSSFEQIFWDIFFQLSSEFKAFTLQVAEGGNISSSSM